MATIHSVGEFQKQATFVNRTTCSTLSDVAVISYDVEQMRRRRSDSEPPKGSQRKGLDTQLPALRLHHLAPNFHALSTHGPLELYEYISAPLGMVRGDKTTKDKSQGKEDDGKGSWLVFFSHSIDFSPVCTMEMASIAKLQDEFAKRGAKILGISMSTVEEHRVWMKDLRKLIQSGGLWSRNRLQSKRTNIEPIDKGRSETGMGALGEEKEMGLEDVLNAGYYKREQREEDKEEELLRFPVIADEDAFVARLYGMLKGQDDDLHVRDIGAGGGIRSRTELARSSFIIDPARRIRMMVTYPYTTGRNATEILRMLDALMKSDQEGVPTRKGCK